VVPLSNQTPKLTSGEIAALWTQYLNETAGLCFQQHMISNMKDQQIKEIFEYAISLSQKHIEKIKEFFVAEGYPVPIGFTENDVNLAPDPLYSDILCLAFLNIMSIHGCHGYSGAVTTCTRKDVRDYFTHCLSSAVELCNRTKDVMLEKGLYYRPPALQPAEMAEFVKDEDFIAGWFGDKRPLSCIEITDIYFNLKKSILAKTILVGFSQVVESEDVRKFLLDAINTKEVHIKIFNNVLNDDNLPAPPTLESEITNLTSSPFSEKLIMFHVGFLFSTAVVYYGTGFASSPRKDLSKKYLDAISDDTKVGNKWMKLMIEKAWLEQPPLAEDRKKLMFDNK
jgi:hypothetical protein